LFHAAYVKKQPGENRREKKEILFVDGGRLQRSGREGLLIVCLEKKLTGPRVALDRRADSQRQGALLLQPGWKKDHRQGMDMGSARKELGRQNAAVKGEAPS